MNEQNGPVNWAYACLLTGGVMIVLGGIAGPLMMGGFGMMGYGMMGNYASYMTTNWFAGMAWWMILIGSVTGGLVLYAAYRIRKDPNDRMLAGTLGIVGGALSLLAMGGWILGAALGILGGALALGQTRAPTRTDDGGARP